MTKLYMWEDLGAACALVLVIEGIMPFLNPESLKNTLHMIIEMDNSTLRIIGLCSMISGVILLYWIR